MKTHFWCLLLLVTHKDGGTQLEATQPTLVGPMTVDATFPPIGQSRIYPPSSFYPLPPSTCASNYYHPRKLKYIFYLVLFKINWNGLIVFTLISMVKIAS